MSSHRAEFSIQPYTPSMPSRLQIASTFALISRLITMLPGQGHANPSVGRLRVASMPILLPHHGMRDAWSSISAGPVTNSRSRWGSMLASARHARAGT